MQWLFPAGAWAFLACAGVLALYFLKRQTVRHDVPSLLLWREAAREQTASRPFQKLKKNILLFLQLLLVILIALSLMRPALPGGMEGETVLIFDASASMGAVSGGRSRMDEAKKMAENLIAGMNSGDRVSVIVAGQGVEQRITRSYDLIAAGSAVGEIEPGAGSAALAEAVSLAEALGREIPGLNIIVYSDTYEAETDAVHVARVGEAADNRAILSLSADGRGGTQQAFARIANFGAAAEVTAECYADGQLVDVRTLSLAEGETGSIVFSVPEEFGTLRAVLTGEDALAADDERWCVRAAEDLYSVAIAGESVFLEKALSLREDLTVVRTTGADLAAAGEFDLIVFVGDLPEEIPAAGNLIAVNPDREIMGVLPGEAKKPSSDLTVTDSGIGENLELSGIAIRTARPLAGGTPVIRAGEDCMVALSEASGRKAAVFAFSLNDSNLPLKADFPILIQNILNWLLPDVRGSIEGAAAGDSVAVPEDGRAVSTRMTLPDGETVDVTPGAPFRDTGRTGVYRLTYAYGDGSEREIGFALHVPDAESDVRRIGSAQDGGNISRSVGSGGREITWIALAALLLVLIGEWVVSRRVA